MSVDNFPDTNILVYIFDDTDTGKRSQAEALVTGCLQRGSGCISYQVVQDSEQQI